MPSKSPRQYLQRSKLRVSLPQPHPRYPWRGLPSHVRPEVRHLPVLLPEDTPSSRVKTVPNEEREAYEPDQ